MVDVTRLSMYAKGFSSQIHQENIWIIASASMMAFLGAFLGNRLLKKVTIRTLQQFVAFFLIIIAICLGAGWI